MLNRHYDNFLADEMEVEGVKLRLTRIHSAVDLMAAFLEGKMVTSRLIGPRFYLEVANGVFRLGSVLNLGVLGIIIPTGDALRTHCLTTFMWLTCDEIETEQWAIVEVIKDPVRSEADELSHAVTHALGYK